MVLARVGEEQGAGEFGRSICFCSHSLHSPARCCQTLQLIAVLTLVHTLAANPQHYRILAWIEMICTKPDPFSEGNYLFRSFIVT